MKVEISRVSSSAVANTPAAQMSKYMCEHVSALMILGGIESIETHKFESGFGSRLHVKISQFKDAPVEVRSAGIIIKDALAQVLSVANINLLKVKPTDEEMANVKSTWEKSVEDSKSSDANGANKASDDGIPIEFAKEKK